MQCVYRITCKINDKCYIGQTCNYNGRVNAHRCDLRKGRGIQKLQSDWNLYGEDSFSFEILQECSDKSRLNELEKYYIKKFNSISQGYNTSPGGIGQGNYKYLNGMYGKHHTEKSKQLMSKNRKGLTAGTKNPNYGNHDNSKFTEEVRKRMSEQQKLRWKKFRESKND